MHLWTIKKNLKWSLQFTHHQHFYIQYISTPSGLSEWFADNVNSRGELFTFIWDGSEEQAKLLSKKSGERIKFRWLSDDEDGATYYFEIRIQVDEITKDVSLMITILQKKMK